MTAGKLKPPLIVLLGPTAVGKTALAVELAARIGAEIISGDSMQFYRYLNIGTAKIRPQEMLAAGGRLIPHHLVDIIDPDEPFSAADFQARAAEKIADIAARGKLPLLVGGTGLYIQALCDGYQLSQDATADETLRERLRGEYERLGAAAMHRRLTQVDPASAAHIAPADQKRLIRALEVFELTGRPISQQGRAAGSPYDLLLLGLARERAALYERIEQRVDMMLAAGLQNEVESLLAMGYTPDLKPLRGLGYRQMCAYLAGDLAYDAAVDLIKRDTRRFAKRQLTWWRRDARINWFDAGGETPAAILDVMYRMVRERFVE